MSLSKKLCINKNSRIYDLSNFKSRSRSCKTLELIQQIVKDPLVSKFFVVILIFIIYLNFKIKNIERDPFFVADLDEIYLRYCKWKEKLPRIEPLYAVKSNYDYYVIKLMSSLGKVTNLS